MTYRHPSLALALALAAGCGNDREPVHSSVPQQLEGDRPDDSPFLDGKQRDALAQLRKASKIGLTGTVFDRAGTLRRLELFVPAPERADTLAETALSFLKAYGVLWKLGDPGALAVVSEVTAKDCSQVVFQLVEPKSGLPVWNALLAVTLTEDGTIRGVSGTLTGAPFTVAGDAKLSAKTAREVLAKELDARGEPPNIAEPVEVVLDPFFYGDEAHAAQRAWLFAPRETPGYAAAVGQTSRKVAFAGPTLAGGTVGSCGGSDPTVLPIKVALDQHTETPTYVDLAPIGGLELGGADPVARAIDLMSRESMARLFGDTAPAVHLQKPRVEPWVGGRTAVRFEEHSNGRRVEGAYLQVLLDRQQRAQTIFARYVWRPTVRPTGNISLAAARVTGDAAYVAKQCAGNPSCEADVTKDLALNPPAAEQIILSSRIYPQAAMPPKEDRLAWRIDYPHHTLYVDAWTPNEHTAGILLDLPKQLDAIPHDIHNLAAGDQLEIRDSVVQAGITPHADSTALAAAIPTIDSFFLGLGRNGFDNAGTRLPMRVQWGVDNSMFCPAPCKDMPEFGLYFGVRAFSPDVIGHEFMHAVTTATANLDYYAESGALNESFSDVFGNVMFPDATPGAWLVGEGTQMGTFRDMRTPGTFGDPGHVGLMNDSCLGGDGCVHTWSGVLNRAAVLISDGGVTGNSHPGVGRATLAAIYLPTLTMMGSTDHFDQLRLRALTTCRALAGQSFGGRLLAPADCDYLATAYSEVGIDPTLLYGYQKFSTGLFGNRWDFVEHAGEKLFNGCTLADHIMWGLDDSGAQQTSSGAQGRSIDFGEWGARVTSRAADGDPTDRTVGYHLWSNWFQTGVAYPREVIARGPGITRDEDCFYPMPPNTPPDPALHLRRMFSTARVSHWATFFNGGRGDDAVNTGALMAAGCQLVGVSAAHDHRGVLEPGVVSSFDHGSHGYTVSRSGTDPRDLSASAHWWHDGLSAIFLRVVYDVLQPDGTDCSVAGATQDTY